MKQEKKWHQTFYTYVWIFNTGRGLSVCIRFPHNVGIIYDLGKSDEFSPCDFVSTHIAPYLTKYDKHRIAQCIMSHPHSDHITEVERIITQGNNILYPYLVTCPHDKLESEKLDFSRIETEDNKEIIATYKKSYEGRNPPLQTITSLVPCNVPNVEYGFYYLVPPSVNILHKKNDQDYGNGVSIVLYLRHGNQSLLLTGDVTPEVLNRILRCGKNVERRFTYFGTTRNGKGWHERTSDQPGLGALLGARGLSILVAPHHGLKSGYCPDLYQYVKGGKPILNVISEKRHFGEHDGDIDPTYNSNEGAVGLRVDIEGKEEKRYSVSTRNGHHILIIFRGTDKVPRVFLRKDPRDLLEIT